MNYRAFPIMFALALVSVSLPAHAQFFGKKKLDLSYCDIVTPRQTVIYIDDLALIDGHTDWAVQLSSKLRGALIHGERVTVVRLSPASGQSKEIWYGCWPGMTAAERAALHQQSTFFGGDPADEIDSQMQFFARDLGQALSVIYADAKRRVAAATIDPANPPPRELFRALASDGSRFAQSQNTVRAIVYSNFAEQSSLGSALQPLPAQPTGFGDVLATHFRRGVFYLFGLGEGISDARANDTIRAFWNYGLRSMSGALEAIGADINLPNVLPTATNEFRTKLMIDGQSLDGRLSLLRDEDGTLVDSWLSVPRMENGTAALSGSFVCQQDGSCKLDAVADNGLVTTSGNGETVSLTGSIGAGLAGEIGVKGSDSFPLRTVP